MPFLTRHYPATLANVVTLALLPLISTPLLADPSVERSDQELPEIKVKAEALSLTVPDTDTSRAQLHAVPGGTTLLDSQQIESQTSGSLENVLKLSPGVYASDRGGDELRLSIRGSGLSQAFAVKGVRYLRNGMPLSEADGDFHSQAIEPLTASHIEIYRGANALEYGASVLGGAINFVTHTGYTAPVLSARSEVGSDGYRRGHLASGQVLTDGWDYYAALSTSQLDGYRDQQATDSTRFYGNLGKRWNAQHESRWHLDIQNHQQELPGSLSLAALKQDPTQANSFFETFNSQNNFDRYRGEWQHDILLSADNQLGFAAFHENQRIDHPLGFGIFDEKQRNSGISYRQRLSHGQRRQQLVHGGQILIGAIDLKEFTPQPGAVRGPLRGLEDSDILTLEWYLENRWQLTNRLTMITGGQLAHAKRKTRFTDPGSNNSVLLSERYTGLSPKLGLLWQVLPQVQGFANLSRSFEAPIMAEFNNAFDAGSGTINPALVLDEQTATTVEVGSRGALSSALNWELALYHSRVHDELLTVEVNLPGSQFATANAKRTRHSGLELGLGGDWQLGEQGNGALFWHSTHSWGRFRFDADPTFGSNTLPGIPAHFGQFEIGYRHWRGWQIGPLLSYAGRYYIDFANSFRADSYLLLGVKAGYQSADKRFSVFIEGRNLEDDAFVANTNTLADAAGGDVAVFNPGQQRAIVATFTLAL